MSNIIKPIQVVFSIVLFSILLIACTKKDDKPPVITLHGSADTTVFLGSTWKDPGVLVKDNYDDRLDYITQGKPNTDSVGVYTITYRAVDNSGNAASATRVVHVVSSLSGMEGMYNVVRLGVLRNDTVRTVENIAYSKTQNNRILITNFYGISNAGIYLELRGDSTLEFPDQIAVKNTGKTSLIREVHFYKGITDSAYTKVHTFHLHYNKYIVDTFGNRLADTAYIAVYRKR